MTSKDSCSLCKSTLFIYISRLVRKICIAYRPNEITLGGIFRPASYNPATDRNFVFVIEPKIAALVSLRSSSGDCKNPTGNFLLRFKRRRMYQKSTYSRLLRPRLNYIFVVRIGIRAVAYFIGRKNKKIYVRRIGLNLARG